MTTKTQTTPLRSIIALFCALVLALSLVPGAALSAHADAPASGTSGECTWTIDGAGTLTIAPTNGSSGTLANLEYHTDNSAPWLGNRSAIKAVVVKPGVKANENLSGMFADCAFITSMDLSGLDTSRATNMESMFLGCTRLASLDVSRFNTANVTDMTMMFKGCAALTSLDVSRFNTSNVAKTQAMFESCSALSSLNVSGFDTSKVEVMTGMFASCSRLSSVDVSKFDTSRVTHMDSMFWGCASLGSIDVSKFDTSKVAVMGNMFAGCSSLSALDVSRFDTSDAISMEGMFYGCKALRSLDLSSFDTSKVTRMKLGPYTMFGGCDDLRDVKLGTGFSFKGATSEVLATLPDGEWRSAALDKTLTAAQIANERNNVADSYSRYIPDDPEAPRPTEPQGDRVTMYRLYNPNSGEHFYTSSTVERDNCIVNGWNDEGVGWIAPSEGQPVYRLYNPNLPGEHHYTMSSVEKNNLVSLGWRDEGVRWYSGGYTPLMREYNPNEYANNHNYTTSSVEHDYLVGIGWNDEGIAWYGIEGR